MKLSYLINTDAKNPDELVLYMLRRAASRIDELEEKIKQEEDVIERLSQIIKTAGHDADIRTFSSSGQKYVSIHGYVEDDDENYGILCMLLGLEEKEKEEEEA